MICVADSGSTKTEWVFVNSKEVVGSQTTIGLNPYVVEPEDIINTADRLLSNAGIDSIEELHFYGAGCSTPEMIRKMETSFKKVFPTTKVIVEHDLLAAARSLCQNEEGIVGIIGTGSSSCHYDGNHISHSVPPLGWIIGDEGAGTAIGKKLIMARYYGEMSDQMAKAFDEFVGISKNELLDRIYNKPFPNKYLASLTKFCSGHLDSDLITSIIRGGMEEFVTRIIKKYNRPDLPNHFTGSLSHVYQDILKEVLQEHGLKAGRIEKSPMKGLLKYHGVDVV